MHAEMEALLACARIGVSPRGSTLYSTTFPCHNCAKHIVAAGVHRVVFIEPYPKSKALELHKDAVRLDEPNFPVAERDSSIDRVSFQPFLGVGPRRYFDLFSLKLSSGYDVKRKNGGGRKATWERNRGVMRVPMLPTSYIEHEQFVAKVVFQTLEEIR